VTDCIRPNPGLVDRVWQATFTVEGARRAGAAGDGLMLSRTQPKPARAPHLSLPEIQNPMIDAYLGALPQGRAPRILASRTVPVSRWWDRITRPEQILESLGSALL
jgi:hypothetical protein